MESGDSDRDLGCGSLCEYNDRHTEDKEKAEGRRNHSLHSSSSFAGRLPPATTGATVALRAEFAVFALPVRRLRTLRGTDAPTRAREYLGRARGVPGLETRKGPQSRSRHLERHRAAS